MSDTATAGAGAATVDPVVEADAGPAVGAATVTSESSGTRGRRHGALGRMRGDAPAALTIGLGVLGVLVLLGGWWLLADSMGDSDFLLPTPVET